jgi:hypothetical protein
MIISSSWATRIALATMGGLMLTNSANAALIVTDYGTSGVPNYTQQFVSEGRIGSNSFGGATFETDIGPSTAAPAAQGQFAWTSGSPVNFTFTYNAGTGLASFDVQGSIPTPLLYTVPTPVSFDTISVRARATSTSQALIQNLVLNGESVLLAADTNPNGIDILGITGFTPSASFTLTGQATFSWTGTVPTNSNLAFQIGVGTAVPEPSSMLGMICFGIVGGAAFARRRSNKLTAQS